MQDLASSAAPKSSQEANFMQQVSELLHGCLWSVLVG